MKRKNETGFEKWNENFAKLRWIDVSWNLSWFISGMRNFFSGSSGDLGVALPTSRRHGLSSPLHFLWGWVRSAAPCHWGHLERSKTTLANPTNLVLFFEVGPGVWPTKKTAFSVIMLWSGPIRASTEKQCYTVVLQPKGFNKCPLCSRRIKCWCPLRPRESVHSMMPLGSQIFPPASSTARTLAAIFSMFIIKKYVLCVELRRP